MVSLSAVKISNSLISTTLPPELVAVFIGATNGIGEITLKKFAKHAIKPRVYFVGRSQEAGDRITAECQALNPEGKFTFLKADVSLIQNVDKLCDVLKEKEDTINLLFLSAGVASLDRSVTSENLHLLAALTHYARLRFITNLLPLIQNATSLRRIVTVGGGSKEGPIDPTDFQALHTPLLKIRGHLITLITLSLEAVARTAHEVTFIHDHPGTVKTGLNSGKRGGGVIGVLNLVVRFLIFFFGRWICVPLDECGERHLYLATSARYPPLKHGNGQDFAVPLGSGVEVARGTTGKVGDGVYTVGWNGESASLEVENLLAGLRKSGMVEQVWKNSQEEFERITGSKKIV